MDLTADVRDALPLYFVLDTSTANRLGKRRWIPEKAKLHGSVRKAPALAPLLRSVKPTRSRTSLFVACP